MPCKFSVNGYCILSPKMIENTTLKLVFMLKCNGEYRDKEQCPNWN